MIGVIEVRLILGFLKKEQQRCIKCFPLSYSHGSGFSCSVARRCQGRGRGGERNVIDFVRFRFFLPLFLYAAPSF